MRGIYRCEDGHLFQRKLGEMLREANLGIGRHRGRCPVDGNRVAYSRIDRSNLTGEQIAEVEAPHAVT